MATSLGPHLLQDCSDDMKTQLRQWQPPVCLVLININHNGGIAALYGMSVKALESYIVIDGNTPVKFFQENAQVAHTRVIGRLYISDTQVQKHIGDAPAQAAQFHHNLVQAARAKLNRVAANLADRVQYWVVANEVLGNSQVDLHKLGQYERERMRLAGTTYGCGLYALANANPHNLNWWKTKTTKTDKDMNMAAVLKVANDAGDIHASSPHVLLLHQYFQPDREGVNDEGYLTADNLRHNVRRFEHHLYDWFRKAFPYLQVIVSEYGLDGRIGLPADQLKASRGWKYFDRWRGTAGDGESYLRVLQALDRANRGCQDVILGYCLFGWGYNSDAQFWSYPLDATPRIEGSSLSGVEKTENRKRGASVIAGLIAYAQSLRDQALLPQLRLANWVTQGLNVRTGPGTDYPVLFTLRDDDSVWHDIMGRSASPIQPGWWQIRVYRIGPQEQFQIGWVHASYVDTSGNLSGVPVQGADVSGPDPAPAGSTLPETVANASGPFHNLATNPDGHWKVWKKGRIVTVDFSSPRAPVQYYARQQPQSQFILPVGFRPMRQVIHRVKGTRVHANREKVKDAPQADFDLTIDTNGEVRYVDNAQVNDLGYVDYHVMHLTWQTNEALAVPTDPIQPGNISQSGIYLNQQVNWGSTWDLKRRGNDVSGKFRCTRSPVAYYANQNREELLRLPADYRPTAHTQFRVVGAIRVGENGADSKDKRRVDFRLTVQPNGEMRYDADTSLDTQGVGYVRYEVDVSWIAAPRITVPKEPRNLAAEDVAARALALDWHAPVADGGAAIEGYRVQVWDGDDETWDNEKADTESHYTRYAVEKLDPYTRYSFRVAARNKVGWGSFSPAITVTTEREAPGAPSALSVFATHEQVTLTWGSASGTITGYRIERSQRRNAWRTLVFNTGETTQIWRDYTVDPVTPYRYRVAAHHHGVVGAWSQERSVTTAVLPVRVAPPGPVGAGTTTLIGDRVTLVWRAPAVSGSHPIRHYRVRQPRRSLLPCRSARDRYPLDRPDTHRPRHLVLRGAGGQRGRCRPLVQPDLQPPCAGRVSHLNPLAWGHEKGRVAICHLHWATHSPEACGDPSDFRGWSSEHPRSAQSGHPCRSIWIYGWAVGCVHMMQGQGPHWCRCGHCPTCRMAKSSIRLPDCPELQSYPEACAHQGPSLGA